MPASPLTPLPAGGNVRRCERVDGFALPESWRPWSPGSPFCSRRRPAHWHGRRTRTSGPGGGRAPPIASTRRRFPSSSWSRSRPCWSLRPSGSYSAPMRVCPARTTTTRSSRPSTPSGASPGCLGLDLERGRAGQGAPHLQAARREKAIPPGHVCRITRLHSERVPSGPCTRLRQSRGASVGLPPNGLWSLHFHSDFPRIDRDAL
jgi:hypothetical protein